MVRIEKDTIEMSRGDAFSIEVTIEDYTILSTDVVKMSIFEADSDYASPLTTITGTLDSEHNVSVISFDESTTSFAEPVSERVDYEYEVKLNGDQTVIGYDKKGPKRLIIYPAETGDTNV